MSTLDHLFMLKKIYRAVEGHFDHPYDRPWMYIADNIHPLFAEIVGKYCVGMSIWLKNDGPDWLQGGKKPRLHAWALWQPISTWWWTVSISLWRNASRFYVRRGHSHRIRCAFVPKVYLYPFILTTSIFVVCVRVAGRSPRFHCIWCYHRVISTTRRVYPARGRYP